MEIDPITIHDPIGETWRMCNLGAREMMIRELIKNAIEACHRKPEGQRDIRLYGTDINDTIKLTIWNRGGMNLAMMKHFSQINIELEKRNALDANFGRGAKIASLMSNMLGMRFRSCFDGRVLEVVLVAKNEDHQVGRVIFDDALPGEESIRDVSSDYPDGRHDFLNLQTDWTEVVLVGNEHDQDTTRRPYLDYSDLPESQWLWDAIGMRFFNIPSDVRLGIHSPITRHRRSGKMNSDGSYSPFWHYFYPMLTRLDKAERHSVVSFPGGNIYYIQAGESFGQNYATKPFGGIVFRDEIHYLHSGTGKGQTTLTSKRWPPLALRWGLTRAYDKVSILIEINEDSATNDINRTKLIGIDKVEIDPYNYATVISDNMPEWVRELDKAPEEDETARSIRDYLRGLMRELENWEDNFQLDGEDNSVEEADEGQGGDGGGDTETKRRRGLQEDDKEKKNASPKKRPMDAPDVQWVSNTWFIEHGEDGMAAYFSRGTAMRGSTIFFNDDHPLFRNLMHLLAGKAPEEAPKELVFDLARNLAKSIAYKVVGTHIVGGISLLRSNAKEEEINVCFSTIVLTAVLATARVTKHFFDAVPEIRRQFRHRIQEVG